MPRLIDADSLISDLELLARHEDPFRQSVILGVVETIRRRPTIDPESLRPHGHWIGEGDGYADGEIVLDVWNCSECDYCIDDGTDDPDMLPKFCPNCGAKMGEEK